MSPRTSSPAEESEVFKVHGKRKKVPQALWRTGQWYTEVLTELTNWRENIWKSTYGNSSLPIDIIMPDQTLLDIAKHVEWRTPDKLGAKWPGFTRYGKGLSEKLEIIDQKYSQVTRLTRQIACKSSADAGDPDSAAPAPRPLAPTILERPRAALPPKCRAPLPSLEGMGIFQVRLMSPGPSSTSTNVDEMTRVFQLSPPGASTQTWIQTSKRRIKKIKKIKKTTAATLRPSWRP